MTPSTQSGSHRPIYSECYCSRSRRVGRWLALGPSFQAKRRPFENSKERTIQSSQGQRVDTRNGCPGLPLPLPSPGLKRCLDDAVSKIPTAKKASTTKDHSPSRLRSTFVSNDDVHGRKTQCLPGDEGQSKELPDDSSRNHTSDLPFHPRSKGPSMMPGRISLKTSSMAKKSTPWLDNLLRDWKNPVFPSARRNPIPFVNPELPNLEPNGEGVSVFGDRAQSRARSHMTSSTLSVKTKLTKDALRTGKVIAQVDSQFILLLVPSDGPGASGLDTLVIVDQHAADERCRVEQLFQQLCEPATSTDSITSNLGLRSSIAARNCRNRYRSTSRRRRLAISAPRRATLPGGASSTTWIRPRTTARRKRSRSRRCRHRCPNARRPTRRCWRPSCAPRCGRAEARPRPRARRPPSGRRKRRRPRLGARDGGVPRGRRRHAQLARVPQRRHVQRPALAAGVRGAGRAAGALRVPIPMRARAAERRAAAEAWGRASRGWGRGGRPGFVDAFRSWTEREAGMVWRSDDMNRS